MVVVGRGGEGGGGGGWGAGAVVGGRRGRQVRDGWRVAGWGGASWEREEQGGMVGGERAMGGVWWRWRVWVVVAGVDRSERVVVGGAWSGGRRAWRRERGGGWGRGVGMGVEWVLELAGMGWRSGAGDGRRWGGGAEGRGWGGGGEWVLLGGRGKGVWRSEQ